MKDIIPIFFATDNNYMPFLDVALNSLTAQASQAFDYHIYVLNTELSEQSKRILSKYNKGIFKLEFVDMSRAISGIEDRLHTRDYYSNTTYYRLFIPDMFPQYRKALYLDCDIVLNGDISELYLTDIGDNYLGAASEEAAHVTPEFSEYAEKFLGLAPRAYFNAGIVIINMDVLRSIGFFDIFFNLLCRHKFTVAQDQDYLNVICKNKVHYFSLAWNKMPLHNPDYTLDNIRLIHFKLAYKPWHYDGILYEEVFWKFAKKCASYKEIVKIKNNYTEKCKQRDVQVNNNLRAAAQEQADDENSYNNLMLAAKVGVLA